MSARTKARKRALDLLYEAEMRGLSLAATLPERQADNDPPVGEYTATLVTGVAAHQPQIDDVIARHAIGWTLARMPAVDRNLLRLGVYELLFAPEVPGEVAVSEAVGLARDLSTDESPAFVNGLLSKVLAERSASPA